MAKLSLPAEAALCEESSFPPSPTTIRRQLVLPNKFSPPSNLSPLEDEFDRETSHHLREIEKDMNDGVPVLVRTVGDKRSNDKQRRKLTYLSRSFRRGTGCRHMSPMRCLFPFKQQAPQSYQRRLLGNQERVEIPGRMDTSFEGICSGSLRSCQ